MWSRMFPLVPWSSLPARYFRHVVCEQRGWDIKKAFEAWSFIDPVEWRPSTAINFLRETAFEMLAYHETCFSTWYNFFSPSLCLSFFPHSSIQLCVHSAVTMTKHSTCSGALCSIVGILLKSRLSGRDPFSSHAAGKKKEKNEMIHLDATTPVFLIYLL